jgi:hypothetical protein
MLRRARMQAFETHVGHTDTRNAPEDGPQQAAVPYRWILQLPPSSWSQNAWSTDRRRQFHPSYSQSTDKYTLACALALTSAAARMILCSYTLLIPLSLPTSGASGLRFVLPRSFTSLSNSLFGPPCLLPVTKSRIFFDLSIGLEKLNPPERRDDTPGGRST